MVHSRWFFAVLAAAVLALGAAVGRVDSPSDNESVVVQQDVSNVVAQRSPTQHPQPNCCSLPNGCSVCCPANERAICNYHRTPRPCGVYESPPCYTDTPLCVCQN